jgi:hypothetical protein
LLGDIEESDAERQARTEASDGETSSTLPSKKPSVRTPLPDHLTLETVMHEAPCVCPTCGATKFGTPATLFSPRARDSVVTSVGMSPVIHRPKFALGPAPQAPPPGSTKIAILR